MASKEVTQATKLITRARARMERQMEASATAVAASYEDLSQAIDLLDIVDARTASLQPTARRAGTAVGKKGRTPGKPKIVAARRKKGKPRASRLVVDWDNEPSSSES
jgi:hypothetical protein